MPYEVQRGDTIAKISALMNTDWPTLKRLNPNAVGRSSRNGNWFLKEGAVLRGPASFEARFSESLKGREALSKEPLPLKSLKAASSSNARPDVNDAWKTYTIRPGDTLWNLAVRRFRVDPGELIEVNGIEDPRTIQPGQVIRIPPAPNLPEEMNVVATWYGR